ncbi:J domain-containing protein [Candidatus Nitrospira bockiana]
MPFNAKAYAKFQAGMRKRIVELRARTEDCLDVAMDSMMEDRVDSYFRIEEGLAEIDRSLTLIEEELAHVADLATAQRLDSRLEFMEDRFEEFDSEVRQRPRRRRRRINMADFFKAAAGGGWGDLPGARGDITNATDAFAALGLEYGSSLAVVTRAFRERAKQLHPDARSGDRSSEPELRRIIEAYQFLKEHLSLSNTEPPVNPGAYSPSE